MSVNYLIAAKKPLAVPVIARSLGDEAIEGP
jgi:hypothetical protein